MMQVVSGMGIVDIMDMPTTVTGSDGAKVHESTLRSYQILEKVKYWLAAGVPQTVILDLVLQLQVAYAARGGGVMDFSVSCCRGDEEL
jgi:hypothetical protein